MVKDIEEIGLRYGVADEAYKYYTGVLYDSSHRQVKNFLKPCGPIFQSGIWCPEAGNCLTVTKFLC